MHARGDHNDGQWHLPQAGLREGMNRRVTSKDVLEVSGVKVLMEVGCCLVVCYACWAQTEDPSGCGAASPSQGRWDPDSLRPALSLGTAHAPQQKKPSR